MSPLRGFAILSFYKLFTVTPPHEKCEYGLRIIMPGELLNPKIDNTGNTSQGGKNTL